MKNWLSLRWKWLTVPSNRKKMYDYMRFGVVPAAIALGFVTPEQADKWIIVGSGLLFFGSSTVAKRNVNDNVDG